MTHPHTHKEEPRSWEEEFENRFCLWNSKWTWAVNSDANPQEVKSFIKDLLFTRGKEVREEMVERFGKMLEVSTMSEEEVNKLLAPYGIVASHS